MKFIQSTSATLTVLFILFSSSCTKEPGFGGLASVEGKVYAKDFTPGGIIEAEGYTADMKVVIEVMGSGQILDETRTDLTGTYKFDKLRKGTYQVYTFTECDTCTNNEDPVVQTIEITEKKQEIKLEDFLIII